MNHKGLSNINDNSYDNMQIDIDQRFLDVTYLSILLSKTAIRDHNSPWVSDHVFELPESLV